MNGIVVFWFRRDLRLEDNHGLFQALNSGFSVLPIFIFDKNILDDLSDKADRRVTFIHNQLKEIKATLNEHGKDLWVTHSQPKKAFEYLFNTYEIKAVYTNEDYEPYAKNRDRDIASLCKENNASFYSYKDQVIFEKDEILKNDGGWYSVYSPYAKKWKAAFENSMVRPFPSSEKLSDCLNSEHFTFPSLDSMGFIEQQDHLPHPNLSKNLLENYADTRDTPSVNGTSRASVHLRFGTVSPRALVQEGLKHSEKWLNELIWREFYMMILYHNPHIVNASFRPEYDKIPWRNNTQEFEKWCSGKTGYPIVDAGMRELNTTGFMHNRVRMITASFLVKHLLIDWRWGEAYFAEKLTDYELSSNNGGWQWAAGSGCDAAPYFRVFNPTLQLKKFDKELKYVQKWVPEYNELTYQQNQVVEHKFARNRAIETYREALKQ